MTHSAEWHRAQLDYWNDGGGERWARSQLRIDRVFEPVTRILKEKADARPGMAVLDIGCGGGAMTLALAKEVGPGGRVMGVDVSAALVELASERVAGAGNAEIVHADASAHPFEPFADIVISRFGVMFFGDPAAAFRNIRKAMKPHGRLVFACWRELSQNPWMLIPLGAVEEAGIPPASRPGPEEPGPFAFASEMRVRHILAAAGFADIALVSAELSLDVAGGGGLDAAVDQAMTIGPAAAALRDQPDSLRAVAQARVHAALLPFENGGNVKLKAAIWLVEASASYEEEASPEDLDSRSS